MKVENKVYIRIHEFECSIPEISNELKLKPSRSWVKGEIIPKRKGDIRRGQSTWEYQSELDSTEPVEKQIESLLDLFESRKTYLKKYSNKYETELSVVVYEYTNYNVGFSLDKSIVHRISEFGLILDVDIYVLLDKN